MLKLAIVAFMCARALALPAAPDTDTALTPPDVERTKRTTKTGRVFRKKAGGARPGVSGVAGVATRSKSRTSRRRASTSKELQVQPQSISKSNPARVGTPPTTRRQPARGRDTLQALLSLFGTVEKPRTPRLQIDSFNSQQKHEASGGIPASISVDCTGDREYGPMCPPAKTLTAGCAYY